MGYIYDNFIANAIQNKKAGDFVSFNGNPHLQKRLAGIQVGGNVTITNKVSPNVRINAVKQQDGIWIK